MDVVAPKQHYTLAMFTALFAHITKNVVVTSTGNQMPILQTLLTLG